MKKIIIIAALFIGFALCTTSCSKEASAQTQISINNFVATYFPNEEVIATIRDGFDYDVTLSDYTQIEFDGNIVGKKLESSRIPENLIAEENEVFQIIRNSTQNRIEQERISVSYIQEKLNFLNGQLETY